MPSRHRCRFFHYESPRAFGGTPGITHRPADAFRHDLYFNRFVITGGKARHQPHGRGPARGPVSPGSAAEIAKNLRRPSPHAWFIRGEVFLDFISFLPGHTATAIGCHAQELVLPAAASRDRAGT